MSASDRKVRATTFMYPWHLAQIGVGDSLRAIRDDGFDAIDLAATYHPVSLLAPGAPRVKLVQTEEGAVMFPARSERYGTVKPRLWPDPAVTAAWPHAATVAAEVGLRLQAWMPVLFQPWLVRDAPGLARVLPTGEAVASGPCPAAPAFREFIARAAADVASQFDVATLQLEGVSFPPFDYHWTAPRLLVDISDWSRWLLGLCFCPSCVDVARDQGIAVDDLRREIVAELGDAWERNEPDDDPRSVAERHEERCAQDQDYAAFIALRDAAPINLVRAILEEVGRHAPDTEIAIWGPIDSHGTDWGADVLLPEVAALQAVNEVMRPGAATAARELADQSPGTRLRTVHWCGRPVGAPLGPEFEQGLRAALDTGTDEVCIFNWAMLPRTVASAIVPMLRDIQAMEDPKR